MTIHCRIPSIQLYLISVETPRLDGYEMITMQQNALSSTPCVLVSWIKLSFDEKNEKFKRVYLEQLSKE